MILDSLKFTVNNHSIKTDSLQSIKKTIQNLVNSKNRSVDFRTCNRGASLVATVGGGNPAFLLFTIGLGVTISTEILEGINGNNSNYRWKFKIIEKQ